jgi:hypothetical protein
MRVVDCVFQGSSSYVVFAAHDHCPFLCFTFEGSLQKGDDYKHSSVILPCMTDVSDATKEHIFRKIGSKKRALRLGPSQFGTPWM